MWKGILVALKGIWKWIMFKNRVEGKIDGLTKALDDIDRRVLRLEILDAMKRKDMTTVHALGDEYLARGYNSYMSDMLHDFYKNNKKPKAKK